MSVCPAVQGHNCLQAVSTGQVAGIGYGVLISLVWWWCWWCRKCSPAAAAVYILFCALAAMS